MPSRPVPRYETLAAASTTHDHPVSSHLIAKLVQDGTLDKTRGLDPTPDLIAHVQLAATHRGQGRRNTHVPIICAVHGHHPTPGALRESLTHVLEADRLKARDPVQLTETLRRILTTMTREREAIKSEALAQRRTATTMAERASIEGRLKGLADHPATNAGVAAQDKPHPLRTSGYRAVDRTVLNVEVDEAAVTSSRGSGATWEASTGIAQWILTKHGERVSGPEIVQVTTAVNASIAGRSLHEVALNGIDTDQRLEAAVYVARILYTPIAAMIELMSAFGIDTSSLPEFEVLALTMGALLVGILPPMPPGDVVEASFHVADLAAASLRGIIAPATSGDV